MFLLWPVCDLRGCRGYLCPGDCSGKDNLTLSLVPFFDKSLLVKFWRFVEYQIRCRRTAFLQSFSHRLIFLPALHQPRFGDLSKPPGCGPERCRLELWLRVYAASWPGSVGCGRLLGWLGCGVVPAGLGCGHPCPWVGVGVSLLGWWVCWWPRGTVFGSHPLGPFGPGCIV